MHALLDPSDSFSSFELTEHLISLKLSPLYLSLDLFLPWLIIGFEFKHYTIDVFIH